MTTSLFKSAFLLFPLVWGQTQSAPVIGPPSIWESVTGPMEVAPNQAPSLGSGDFTLSMWIQPNDKGEQITGDLISRYDPGTRRGFMLTLKSSPGVTSNQANWRNLQFGIDDNHASDWQDRGRPGQAILPFALASHAGSLYAGTCEPLPGQSGRVYRLEGKDKWVDCGAPDGSNAVTALAEHQGHLFAGTGCYRLAGSSLPESPNQKPGGRVFRYLGEQKWLDCGQLPDTVAVGGLVTFQGHLHATSLYRPAGFFRLEDNGQWTRLAVPRGTDPNSKASPKRPVSLSIHGDHLMAGSYDGGHVHRWDGKAWADLGQLGDNTQTYSFAQYQSRLHVGTWPSGRVYRLDSSASQPPKWTDIGRLGDELEVMGMLVHNGRLIAGTLPLAEVYSFQGESAWKKLTRLDHTPDVKYRRAWTMAEHGGKVFCSTLPSGKVFSWSAGKQVTWDHPFPPGWHHIVAMRAGDKLRLLVDNKEVAEVADKTITGWNLDTQTPLRLGTGENGPLNGQLKNIQIHLRALEPAELARLAQDKPVE